MRMAEGAGRRLMVLVLSLAVLVGGGYAAARFTPWGHRALVAARHVIGGGLNQSTNYHETAQAAANNGPPFVTPAANAMLRSLKIEVVQARWLPTAYADLGPDNGVPQYTDEAVDVELRITNTSNRLIHMSNQAYTETGCLPYLQMRNEWTDPAVLESLAANLYTMTPKVLASADTPNNVGNSPTVYLNLNPHQTKVGWLTATYVTNCGSSPNVILFTDSWPSSPNGGAVTISLPVKPSGPPLPVPAPLP